MLFLGLVLLTIGVGDRDGEAEAKPANFSLPCRQSLKTAAIKGLPPANGIEIANFEKHLNLGFLRLANQKPEENFDFEGFLISRRFQIQWLLALQTKIQMMISHIKAQESHALEMKRRLLKLKKLIEESLKLSFEQYLGAGVGSNPGIAAGAVANFLLEGLSNPWTMKKSAEAFQFLLIEGEPALKVILRKLLPGQVFELREKLRSTRILNHRILIEETIEILSSCLSLAVIMASEEVTLMVLDWADKSMLTDSQLAELKSILDTQYVSPAESKALEVLLSESSAEAYLLSATPEKTALRQDQIEKDIGFRWRRVYHASLEEPELYAGLVGPDPQLSFMARKTATILHFITRLYSQAYLGAAKDPELQKLANNQLARMQMIAFVQEGLVEKASNK